MKKRTKRMQRILVALLCLALCAADIVPTGMTVLASEQMPQENPYSSQGEADANKEENDMDAEKPDTETPDDQGTPDDQDTPDEEGSQGEEDQDSGSKTPGDVSQDEEEKEDGDAEKEEDGKEKEDGSVEKEDGEEKKDGDTEKDEDGEEKEDGDAEKEEDEEEIDIEDEAAQEETAKDPLVETKAVNMLVQGVSNNIAWSISQGGKLTVTGTGDFERDEKGYVPWYRWSGAITSAEINVTGMTNARGMFATCGRLKSLNLSGFDTSQITNMSWMFADCQSLTSLDLRKLDFGQVTDMSYMFTACIGLTSLNLSGLDFGHVTNMSYMFSNCFKLTSLNLSGLNTAQVTDMSYIFSSCDKLTSLNLSGLDTGNVNNMSGMFNYCSKLTSLNLSGFDTGHVTNMSRMFYYCENLTSLNLNGLDTGHVTNMSGMFSGCDSLSSLDVTGLNTSQVTDMSGMFSGCDSLSSLDVTGLNTSQVTDMGSMFSGCKGLSSLDVTGFDTGQVTDMGSMFSGCASLSSLDVTGFDTGQVTDMRWMFSGCASLTSLDVTGFDTAQVTDMGIMFSGCEKLTGLDVSGFKTGQVSNMSSMFSGCGNLTGLDVSGFDTGQVSNMSSMFSDCGNLSTLDVSSFNTGQVTGMGGMFSGCRNLSTLDVSSFDTGKVSDMSSMFSGCEDLTSLDVSGFDTSNVTSMSGMFTGNSSLQTLDLSSFDLRRVSWLGDFLSGCPLLSIIYTPRNVQVSISLPMSESDTGWYQYDGTVITELPQRLDRSIVLMKNGRPDFIAPYIEAAKDKTSYRYDEEINTDDITVTYYNAEGTAVKITEGYTIRVVEISGGFQKKLVVTYRTNEGKTLTAGIDLTIYILAEDEVASGISNKIAWSIDENGKLTVEGEGDYKRSSYDSSSPWPSSLIRSAEINVTGMTDASRMFYGCRNLKSLDLSGFDTSRVTDMSRMFYECSALTSLDLSGLDTSRVTDMGYMFSSCTALTSLNLSGLDTGRVTNMRYMFRYCKDLTSLDLSGFDTGQVTDMSEMFSICEKMVKLNLSGFDTSRVTNMNDMFSYCETLRSLDLSSFDTSQVTDMGNMFYNCRSLSALDISSFHTEKVTDMQAMFVNCSSLSALDLSGFSNENATDMSGMFMSCSGLKTLDLSSFHTDNVTDMSVMFYNCSGLSALDLSSFDTGKVTDMGSMFQGCSGLKSLNVSRFDTRNVMDMSSMFRECSSLTGLDLSSFDCSSWSDLDNYYAQFTYVLKDCSGLSTIYSPRNLEYATELPTAGSNDTWYRADGQTIRVLPMNEANSIVLTKNKKYEASEPYISAEKRKTTYLCNEQVEVDDIIISYFDGKGSIMRVTEGFETNVAEVNRNMNIPGKKDLRITYIDPSTKTESRKLETVVELTVTLGLTQDIVTIALPDIGPENSLVYNGNPQTPKVEVKLAESGTVLSADTDYAVSYQNNVHVGEAAVVITGAGVYSGELKKTFTIVKAPLTLRMKNVNLVQHDPMPEKFAYETEGLAEADRGKTIQFSLIFKDKDGTIVDKGEIDTGQLTSETGKFYYIIPSDVDAGADYDVNKNLREEDIRGKLIITTERIVYTVTLDMAGHGSNGSIEEVKAGSLITEPEKPTAEGYVFTGWYKDSACTKVWDFDTDTVQADITLYACWLAQAAQDSICIQEIEVQSYTGSAIKPKVIVYAADGETCLKSGKDYTVKYYNNIEADKPEEAKAGGTNQKGEEGTNGFTADLAYVVVTGKGNHTGTVYSNFHIRQASISDADGNAAAGFTFKYTDQLAVNTNKAQKAFGSLKYKKAMKAGTDYSVALSAVAAYDAEGNMLKAADSGVWTVTGSSADKYIPDIPKGYKGTFLMTVEGMGNYTGTLSRTIHVAEKTELIKNVTITLGKNQKTVPYQDGNGGEMTLHPGYYDTAKKKYYTVSKGGIISETAEDNANHIFTVKSGKKYLVYDRDYTVSYQNNRAVGTAAMTITGIGEYVGSKSVAFKISGTVLNARNVTVTGIPDNRNIIYNGNAQIWNKETKLTLKKGGDNSDVELVYGEDYTITYKNNIKKGTASMTFTGKAEAGYSGSFTKNFKIAAADIADPEGMTVAEIGKEGNKQDILSPQKDADGNIVYRLTEAAAYSREGVKPSGRIRLTNRQGKILREGVDYTVSYANNAAVTSDTAQKLPTMTIKGKGNYTGSLKVTFAIRPAAMENNANLTFSAAAAAFNTGKEETYLYQPKITVKDGKKALKADKDYTVDYRNCSQQEVTAYLEALEAAGTPWDKARSMRPYAVVWAAAGSGYTTENGITVDLNVYRTKLTGGNLYIVVSEEPSQVTYFGKQVKPGVTVYYGDAKAVSEAKRNKETEERSLTAAEGAYKLTKLTWKADADAEGDYTLTYGANVAAGKNKGSVTVTGSGIYGGSVTVKFTIAQRDVYNGR